MMAASSGGRLLSEAASGNDCCTCQPDEEPTPPSSPPAGDDELLWLTPKLQLMATIWFAALCALLALGTVVYVMHRVFTLRLRILAASAKRQQSSAKRVTRGRAVTSPTVTEEDRVSLRDDDGQTVGMARGSQSTTSNDSLPRDEADDAASSLDDDFQELGLSFIDLHYWAPNGAHLLRGVTGYINPGELVAVMGPSGSGKTTCLDVLAGRRRTGTMGGEVYVNGRPLHHGRDTQAYFAANTGYMLQLAEAFCAELTVRENLAYAAMLRLPASTPLAAKMKRVNEVISELNIGHIAEVRVGTATGGGISGGQKRKLMLGIELLSKPALLFLDEPTSGLDTTSAMDVIVSLRAYCASGRAVAVTIHQPRSDVFAAFDRLLLMYRGGVAFFGPPLAASAFLLEAAACLTDAKQRFEDASNPADIVLDILNHEGSIGIDYDEYGWMEEADEVVAADRTSRIDRRSARTPRGDSGKPSSLRKAVSNPQLASGSSNTAIKEVHAHNIGSFAVTMFELSGNNKRMQQAIEACIDSVRGSPSPAPPRRACAGLRQSWTRLWALESRLLRRTSLTAYYNPALQFALLAAVLGTVFYRAEKIYVFTGTLYNLSFFMSALVLSPLVAIFSSGLSSTYRFESDARVCAPWQYLAHHQLHFLFWSLVGQLPFVTIVYYAVFTEVEQTRYLWRYLWSVALWVFDTQAFQALFLSLCCLCYWIGVRLPSEHLIVCGVAQAFLMFFCGFFVSFDDTPHYWQWAMWINPRFYTLSAIMRINLEGFSLAGDCRDDSELPALRRNYSEAAAGSAERARLRASIDAATLAERVCLQSNDGDGVLAQYSYADTDVGLHALVLLLMWLAFTLIALLLLQAEHGNWSLLSCLRGTRGLRRKPADSGGGGGAGGGGGSSSNATRQQVASSVSVAHLQAFLDDEQSEQGNALASAAVRAMGESLPTVFSMTPRCGGGGGGGDGGDAGGDGGGGLDGLARTDNMVYSPVRDRRMVNLGQLVIYEGGAEDEDADIGMPSPSPSRGDAHGGRPARAARRASQPELRSEIRSRMKEQEQAMMMESRSYYQDVIMSRPQVRGKRPPAAAEARKCSSAVKSAAGSCFSSLRETSQSRKLSERSQGSSKSPGRGASALEPMI